MRRLLSLAAVLLAAAGPAPAPVQGSVEDVEAVPYLDGQGRADYQRFLQAELPRAFAISPDGHHGLGSEAGTPQQTRDRALRYCRAAGGSDCALYADGLDVVWPGHEWRAPSPPDHLIANDAQALLPDPRFLWHGGEAAAGAIVWAHDTSGTRDMRTAQPPPFVRLFNNAGFDVLRFDRDPGLDTREGASAWLRADLRALRRFGYRRIVAAGMGRGAWNAIGALDGHDLADVVIAISPVAGDEPGDTARPFDALIGAAEMSSARIAYVQFEGDALIPDLDGRHTALERALKQKVGALLLIDRPDGFDGHDAGDSTAFSRYFGACLLRFATAPVPPHGC
jgi:hypothetical protein